MRNWTRFLLTTALAAYAFPTLAQATAETAPTQNEPSSEDTTGQADIVVTGIRQSLEAARDIKRNSTQFVDAIVADDIGKLPDVNVAESLARVSGVQVERGIGEGTDVSIRGLRENVILYNGRQILDATGRGGNGLDQLGGSTYGLLALVPSDLISRLAVTKLAGADQIAGALGGLVDIETRLPLAGADGTTVSASGAATYDELAEKAGFELFGLASTRLADDTLGVLLTASYTKRFVAQQGLDTFSGYTRFNDATVTPARARFGHADVRAQDIQETREKLGLSGVVQWQPSDGIEVVADTFYSKLTSERDRFWLSFNPTVGLTNARYSDNDILLSGRSAGAVLTNTEFADIESEVWSSALKGKFQLSDLVRTSAEVSWGRSEASYDQRYFRLQPVAGITPVVDFDLTAGDFGSYSVSGIDLTNPAQLRFTILFDNLFRSRTDNLALRNDWTFDLGPSFLRTVEMGARYQELDTVQDPLRADIRPAGGIAATMLGEFTRPYANPDFLPNGFGQLPRAYLAANRATLTGCSAFTAFPAVSQNAQCLNPAGNVNALSSTFRIKERFLDAYGKLNFEGRIGSGELSGNVGVRFVRRDLDSTGNLIAASGAATPTVFERRDEEFLPSGVLKLSFDDRLILRLGAAKVVAFPNTEDLNNGVVLNNNALFENGVQTQPGTGSGGAPNLDPFKANQLDASVEWYFGPEALLSAGLFYKDVSTFIIQRQSPESYGGVNFLINRKVNGDSAEVKGVEVLAQVPFTFLPGPLDGLGVVATYSYIDSKTPIRDVSGRTLTFPGLSKNNVNLIGFYEKGPVSLRVAYNWRDDFLVGLSAAATGIYNDAFADLSATFRYDLTKALSLTLEGNNLLNSQQRTYDGVSEALRTNVVFGRVYKATLSVRF